MNEIYTDSQARLRTSIYVNETLSDPAGGVTIDIINLDTNTAVVTGAPATRESIGIYTYTIGPTITGDPSRYKALWHYTIGTEDFERREVFRVVVPYVSVRKVQSEMLPDKTIEEVRNMESLVRHVIEAYCGQTFEYRLNRSKTVMGRGTNTLDLPERLYNLTGLTLGRDLTGTIAVESLNVYNYVETDPDNPWQIRRRQYSGLSPRAVEPGIFGSGPFFRSGKMYVVTGDWGWPDVPGGVVKAAEILIDKYFCQEARYRDSYIDNIRAADWRMEFARTGDETTGSANADMILQDFRNMNMVII